MIKKIIQQLIIPLFVTVAVMLLTLFLSTEQNYGLSAKFETFFIFILPLFPLMYGYATKNKIGSVLIGVMPFLGFFGLMLFEVLKHSNVSACWLNKAMLFYLILIIIIGSEGYFASQRKKSSFSIACGLYILWILVFYLVWILLYFPGWISNFFQGSFWH